MFTVRVCIESPLAKTSEADAIVGSLAEAALDRRCHVQPMAARFTPAAEHAVSWGQDLIGEQKCLGSV
jgi:hypothetical protein